MIKVNSVSKSFRMNKTSKSFFDFLSDFNFKKENFLAVKNISFELKEGDILGVVGKNGSGKSTLLKTISGILKTTSGDIKVYGEIVYISGFYHGMNKNLSMRDNIYIIGTLNNLSKDEINQRVDKITDFSEMQDFLDVPLYQFSSGMITRLALTTTLFTLPKSPDILILDEALGGGLDDYFRDKALNKINEYVKSAKAVIIASHNLNYLQNHCTKILWINNGEMKDIGETQKIIQSYSEFLK